MMVRLFGHFALFQNEKIRRCVLVALSCQCSPRLKRARDGLEARWASEFVNPAILPSWLTEADVDFYAGEFARTGFSGGLNWYRNIDRNWELLAPFAGAQARCRPSTSLAIVTRWWPFQAWTS
jgi:hypothetical protein